MMHPAAGEVMYRSLIWRYCVFVFLIYNPEHNHGDQNENLHSLPCGLYPMNCKMIGLFSPLDESAVFPALGYTDTEAAGGELGEKKTRFATEALAVTGVQDLM